MAKVQYNNNINNFNTATSIPHILKTKSVMQAELSTSTITEPVFGRTSFRPLTTLSNNIQIIKKC